MTGTLESGRQIESVYADFSKAFDRTNPTLAIAKLNAYVFDATFLERFKSYFQNRTEFQD